MRVGSPRIGANDGKVPHAIDERSTKSLTLLLQTVEHTSPLPATKTTASNSRKGSRLPTKQIPSSRFEVSFNDKGLPSTSYSTVVHLRFYFAGPDAIPKREIGLVILHAPLLSRTVHEPLA